MLVTAEGELFAELLCAERNRAPHGVLGGDDGGVDGLTGEDAEPGGSWWLRGR